MGRCRWALAFLVAVCAGSGQEPTDYRLTVRSNLVFLPTRVQTRKGATVYGLRPDEFLVYDNGVRQSVKVDEDPESTGLSLVVVVQCSRSTPSEFAKMGGLGTMIEAIAGGGPHEVAVMSYGPGPYVLGDFSGRTEDTNRALAKLRPCGDFHAATIDAVYFAINMLNRRRTHYRRAILLIGETRDHGSRARLEDVVTQLGITDTVIYAVAFSPARDQVIQDLRYGANQPPAYTAPPKTQQGGGASPPEEPQPVYEDHAPLFALPPQFLILVNALRRNSAAEMASLSGGEYLNFTTRKGLEAGLERISNRVHDYYLLSYQPPAATSFGLHKLEVRIAGRPEAVIQTRKSYWSGVLEGGGGR